MALKGYGTPLEIAAMLGYDYSDSVLMSEIQAILSVAEWEVDQYCQTTFVNEAATSKIYSGNGTKILTLGFFLRTLTSVWTLDEDGAQDTQLDDVVMQPSAPRTGAYRWLERRQSEVLLTPIDSVFPVGLNNIKITGDWGFTECPEPIKWATALTVKHMFNLRTYNSTISNETGVNRTVDFVRSDRVDYIPRMAKQILDKWRNSRQFCE